MVRRAEACDAWRRVHEGMRRFGMESDAIDTLDEYFREQWAELKFNGIPISELAAGGQYHPGDDT